jgi:hypothetical protein
MKLKYKTLNESLGLNNTIETDLELVMAEIDRLTEEKERILQLIKTDMISNNLKSVSGDKFKYVRVDQFSSMRFDTSKFKTVEPELYNKYLKESVTKETYKLSKLEPKAVLE